MRAAGSSLSGAADGISATALFVVYVFALIALSLWLVTRLSAEAAEGGIGIF
jgi:hypothetical protein